MGDIRGTHGIQWLATELDEFAHDTAASDGDDARFVEGGGALLGLLLIDHLGGHCSSREGAEPEHRVHLGPDDAPGTFDPFGAVDAALDADEPMRGFARSMAEAEEEAAGRGPGSRCVLAFARALERDRPGRRVERRHALELRLDDGTEVDLERLRAAENPDEAARRLVSLLPGGPIERVDWSVVRERLFPRLVGQRFVDELGPRGDALQIRPLTGAVHVALQLRYEGRSRFVRRDEVDAWLDRDRDPAGVALRNLRDAAPSLDVRPVQDGVFALTRGDALDATRLLLPQLADELEDRIGRPFLAAVPHRDVLLLAADDLHAERALRAHARELFSRAPHPIAAHLLQVDGTRITDA